ncbi:MAG: 6-bladed beta-propeller, partial [Gammaproteobacteria bacterium]|nr:6-bladed beta-propeller [Gammaproteobacteria bacterium]
FKIIGTEGKGMLLKPMGIVISKQLQELFVVDISAKRIAVFDLEGKYKRQIGRPADFVRPTGIAISNNGEKIYVVETGGINSDDHHVLILDSQSGKLIKKVGHRGTQDGEFNIPLSITVTPDGDFFVIDSGNFRVQRFSHNGIYKSQFGSIGRRGGQFSRPKSISSDSQGNIYVVDTAFGNFQIFTPQGQLLLHVGDRGTSGGPARFMLPAGIDVDEQGRVYMIDQFFRKLEIFLPSGIEALPLLVKH